MGTRCVRWICLACFWFFGDLRSRLPRRPARIGTSRWTCWWPINPGSRSPARNSRTSRCSTTNSRKRSCRSPQRCRRDAAANADPPVEVVLMVDEVNTDFTRCIVRARTDRKVSRSDGGELPRPGIAGRAFRFRNRRWAKLTTQDGNALAGGVESEQSRAAYHYQVARSLWRRRPDRALAERAPAAGRLRNAPARDESSSSGSVRVGRFLPARATS